MYRKIIYEKYLSSVNFQQKDLEKHFNSALKLQKEVEAELPVNKSARILDLGCGFGTFLNYLKQSGYTNLYGVELGSEQIEFLKTKGLNVKNADIFEFLTNSEEKYDLITLFDVLEHFNKNELVKLIPLLKRNLTSSGKIIIRVPNGEAIFKGSIMYGDFTHETYFTKRSLIQLFKTFDFKTVDVFPAFYLGESFKARIAKFIFMSYVKFYKTLLYIDNAASVEFFIPTQNIYGIIKG